MPWLKDQPSLSRTDRVLFTQCGPDPQHEVDHDTEMPVERDIDGVDQGAIGVRTGANR